MKTVNVKFLIPAILFTLVCIVMTVIAFATNNFILNVIGEPFIIIGLILAFFIRKENKKTPVPPPATA